MYQESLFPESETAGIVNVASVPQRSPFRYPGGKTWFVPRLRQWMRRFTIKPAGFIEPFAGGGIISLTVAFEELACHVTMVERDEQVAAVWHTILNGPAEWLTEKILAFELTPDTVREEFQRTCHTTAEFAFHTILKNRVSHGGILAPGSGILKQGENGKGITSRWYPETLTKRIRDIQQIKSRIQFIEGDGLSVLRVNAHRSECVFFIDPPYTAAGKKAGKRLYTHHELDHEELFRVVAMLRGDFVMTYDNDEGVLDLARRHGFDTRAIPMKNTHHAEMTELLIGRDLTWMQQ